MLGGGAMWGVDGPHAIMMIAGTVDWGILGVVKNKSVVGESGYVATVTELANGEEGTLLQCREKVLCVRPMVGEGKGGGPCGWPECVGHWGV